MDIKKLLKKKYSPKVIEKKRIAIAKRFIGSVKHIKSSQLEQLKDSDLQRLAMLYDEVFFDNCLKHYSHIEHKYYFSKKLKKSGGLTRISIEQSNQTKEKRIKTIEIRINVNMVFDYKFTNEDRYACGILVESSLEALMVILEHELCHVIEFIAYGKSEDKGKVFQKLTHSLFGHKEFTHSLMTETEKNIRMYTVMVGDTVKLSLNGRLGSGIVQKIEHQRATVLVYDPDGRYVIEQNGRRCSKYVVPVKGLIKVSERKRDRIDFRL